MSNPNVPSLIGNGQIQTSGIMINGVNVYSDTRTVQQYMQDNINRLHNQQYQRWAESREYSKTRSENELQLLLLHSMDL